MGANHNKNGVCLGGSYSRSYPVGSAYTNVRSGDARDAVVYFVTYFITTCVTDSDFSSVIVVSVLVWGISVGAIVDGLGC